MPVKVMYLILMLTWIARWIVLTKNLVKQIQLMAVAGLMVAVLMAMLEIAAVVARALVVVVAAHALVVAEIKNPELLHAKNLYFSNTF